MKLLLPLMLITVIGCKPTLKTVARSTDQTKLFMIANAAEADDDVRKAAIEKLKDQAMLAKIALESDILDDVREAAISRLTDQHQGHYIREIYF